MKLSERLLKKAEYFKCRSPQLVALEMLKQAGLDEDTAKRELAVQEMEKSASSALVHAGIDYDEAVKMVKAAGEDEKITSGNFSLDAFGEAFDALMKIASLAQELEAQVEASSAEKQALLEKVASYEEVLNSMPESDPLLGNETLEKAAAIIGADSEDIAALQTLPANLLEKIAAGQPTMPSMGRPEGRAKPMDALDQFLFGDN